MSRHIEKSQQAAEMFQKEQGMFKFLFENAKDAIFWGDPKTGLIINCNKAAEDLLEKPKQEIVGKEQTTLHPPDKKKHYVDMFKKHIANKEARGVEAEIITASGKTKPVSITASITQFDGNEIIQGIFRDITERKKDEDSLKITKFIAEKAADSIFLIGPEAKFHYVNNKACDVLGYSREELLRMRVHDIDPNYPRKAWPGHWKELKKHSSFTIETVHITKTGKFFPVEVRVNLLRLGDKDFNCAFARDITERKKAIEVLRGSENRYRAMFENSPISLWEEDFSDVKGYVDALRLKGVKDFKKYFSDHPEDVADCATKARIINVNKATMDLYRAKDKEEFWGGLTRVFSKESYNAFRKILITISEGNTEFEFETFNKTLRDKKIRVKIRAVVMPGHEKSWSRTLVSIVDMTEITQAKKKLEELNKELRKSNRKLEQMVLVDSHTGLYNHRYLAEILEREFYRAKRYSHPLALIMADIDYFKSINDVYGHQFGDLVLKQFAKHLQKMVRKHDTIIRFGGEEFVILSPKTGLAEAANVAHRILNSVNLHNFGSKEYTLKLKLSLGVCSYPEDPIVKPMDLIALSERILNRAKEFGGNNVYTSSDLKDAHKMQSTHQIESTNMSTLKKKIDKLSKQANQNLAESVFALARTIEFNDQHTGDHVERTVLYATQIAEGLGLPKDEVERIKKAAILHDLGKVGVSEKILNKKTSLNKTEVEEIRKHPQIAADILRPIQYLHDIIPLVLGHHEKWNGKGYPQGLKGKEIPIGARVITLADGFQAITSKRPYRKAYTKKKAIKIIKQEAGTKYDPLVVKTFLNILKSRLRQKNPPA